MLAMQALHLNIGLDRHRSVQILDKIRRQPMVSLPRRIRAALVSASILFTAQAATAAETYPQRPITLVVGYAAGGATDIAALALARPAVGVNCAVYTSGLAVATRLPLAS